MMRQVLQAARKEESLREKVEAPEHLQAFQALALSYQDYMSYLKQGGNDGVSNLLGSLVLVK